MSRYFLTGFLISLAIFITLPAYAANGWKENATNGLNTAAGVAGLDQTTPLNTIIGNIIGTALSIMSIVFLIMCIYGGFRWMLARGNEEATKKGLDAIFAAIIGLLITLSAYAITSFVMTSTKQGPSDNNGGNVTINQCETAGYQCVGGLGCNPTTQNEITNLNCSVPSLKCCGNIKECTTNENCIAGMEVCTNNKCVPSDTSRECHGDNDCVAGIEKCINNKCAITPTCTDGTKNGNETDIDCGGSCPQCATGKNCVIGTSDCLSNNCVNSVCVDAPTN